MQKGKLDGDEAATTRVFKEHTRGDFSMRLRDDLRQRLDAIKAKDQWQSAARSIEECLEEHLPKIEQRKGITPGKSENAKGSKVEQKSQAFHARVRTL
jgi:predicted transcriptional regulator